MEGSGRGIGSFCRDIYVCLVTGDLPSKSPEGLRSSAIAVRNRVQPVEDWAGIDRSVMISGSLWAFVRTFPSPARLEF